MATDEFNAIASAMSPTEKTEAAITLTKSLGLEQQKDVVARGIDPGVWPQNSRDRMITILGALVIAGLVLAVGVWASTFAGAATIVTAAPLLASAIVGSSAIAALAAQIIPSRTAST
jgi:hypothetical protein